MAIRRRSEARNQDGKLSILFTLNKNKMRILLTVLIMFCTLMQQGCKKETTEPIRFEFRLEGVNGIECYSVEKCYRVKGESEVVIPDMWEGLPVLCIEGYAFLDAGEPSRLDCGAVQIIKTNAFFSLQLLKEVNLRNVRVIGEAAFVSCSSLESIVIPESVEEIGSWAFTDCTALRHVYFEGDPSVLGRYIFRKQATLYGMPGGNVEQYAQENGLSFCDIALADQ